MNDSKQPYIHLPRGGLLIPTKNDHIQFGSPPETIKDTMTMPGGVPATYIVPHYMFNLQAGTAFAEMEFPIYFNFFIKQGKVRIICSKAQHSRLLEVISESVFGPGKLDIESDYVDGADTPGFPDIRAEMNFFRRMPPPKNRLMTLDDIVEFVIFDDAGHAEFGDFTIDFDQNRNLTITEKGETIAEIDGTISITAKTAPVKELGHIFQPPLFGITTLGSGHGFDPDAMTSGMIIWLNRRGLIVDPPVNSTDNLHQLGVNPKLIDSVFLTHCHADHDAGTLQKLLQEGKLDLYTTQTVYNGFLRKSSALTGIDRDHLRKLVTFFPITVGQPMNISGGEFHFRYTIHSIPTVAFKVSFAEKNMVYSSDTLNHPDHLKKLHQEGVLSKERLNSLLDFPWDQTVIFHEAGIPPLHTPLDYLCSLPREIREKMFLVHVSPGSIPEDCGLTIAPTGLANTLELDVNALPFDEAIEALDVFSYADIFQNLTIAKARQFLIISEQKKYRQGDIIFRQGDPGDNFYFVVSGKVDIVIDDQILTTYSNSDYFGEKSLFSDESRTAMARARTDLILLAINKLDMLSFIRGTESETLLQHLATYQNKALRDVLDQNHILSSLTPSQQTQLHRVIKPVSASVPAQAVVVECGATHERCHIIRQGAVGIYRSGRLIDTLKVGGIFGVKTAFAPAEGSEYRFKAMNETSFYAIEHNALQNYIDKNPGVYIKLFHYPY